MVGKNLRETDAGKNRHRPGLLLGRPNFVRWVLEFLWCLEPGFYYMPESFDKITGFNRIACTHIRDGKQRV